MAKNEQVRPQASNNHSSNNSGYAWPAADLLVESVAVVQTAVTPEHQPETQNKQNRADKKPLRWFLEPEWMMVWLTLVYVIVSAITLLIIKHQSKITETAANAALQSANTADATLKLMKDTAERQLRAYVLPVNAQRVVRGLAHWIKVEIKNSGSTPAYDFRGFLATDIADLGNEREDVVLPPGIETSQAVIPSGGTLELGGPMRDLTTEQEIAVSGGSQAVYAYGNITYADAFGTRRCTKFRFFCTGELLATGRFAACTQGNEAT